MNWLPYLLESSLLLIVLYGAYWLLLRKETYYQWNRIILLSIPAFALLLPVVPVSQVMVEFSHQYIPQEAIPIIDTPGDVTIVAIDSTASEQEAALTTLNWKTVLFYCYLAGLLFLGLRFLFGLYGIVRLLIFSRIERLNNCILAYSEEAFQPLSFFKIICLGKDDQGVEARKQILIHESIHARQWHSLDIFLIELFSIFFWFHPFTTLLKRSVKLNLEFIADEAVLAKGANRKAYQYSLLKVSTHNKNRILTNSFNHSFIKKRIIMMNSKKSPEWKKWKFLFFLPLLLGMYTLTNVAQAQGVSTETVVKEKNKDKQKDKVKDKAKDKAKLKSSLDKDVMIVIGADLDKANLEDLQQKAQQVGMELIFHQLDYTSDGKISGISMDAVIHYKGGQARHNISLFPKGEIQEKIMVYRVNSNTENPSYGMSSGTSTPEGLPSKYDVIVQRVQGITIVE